ncbi:MAG: hypothetical protein R2834_24750 [Rhodothermales bacterium]
MRRPPPARADRVEIRLDGFDPASDIVVANAAGLLRNIDLTQGTPAPPGCMSGPSDPDCAGMFANLGIDLDSGRCTGGCDAQSYIRLASAAERERLAIR